MDFSNADFGVNVVGVNQYIEDLNAVILKQVASTIRNTQDIESSVRAGWHGVASEQFISNINKAKEKVIETLQNLHAALETEMKGIQSKIIDMDANLVEEE